MAPNLEHKSLVFVQNFIGRFFLSIVDPKPAQSQPNNKLPLHLFCETLVTIMDRADAKFSSVRIDVKNLDVSQSENFEFSDDIDCQTWLTEINLAQYAETFLVNLSSDHKHIRRKRLNQLRQQDLSAMNITNFAHQKRLMEHVRLVLKFPFHSPVRRKEIKDLYIEPIHIEPFEDRSQFPSGESKSSRATNKTPAHKLPPIVKEQTQLAEKKKQARRRRSFDSDVWNSISTMRKKSVNNAAIAEQLRQGVFSNPEEHPQAKSSNNDRRSSVIGGPDSAVASSRDRHRRWSFHGNDGESYSANVQAGMERARAVMYGNMALEYDMMLTNLNLLQTEVLNQFKETINCEVASLFFANHRTQELLLCNSDSKWYRVPFGVGICGYCMETGENVNIPNAYEDPRFNKNMDLKTGFKTRSILCQPVRGMRGGGAIIGVIQMLNKRGEGTDGDSVGVFDAHDEELLANFSSRVADMLSVKFTDLNTLAEKFSGQAMFVGSKGGNMGDRLNHHSHTEASSNKHISGGGGGGGRAITPTAGDRYKD